MGIVVLLALTTACSSSPNQPTSAATVPDPAATEPAQPSMPAALLLVSRREAEATYDQASLNIDEASTQSTWVSFNVAGNPPVIDYDAALALVATFGVGSCVEDVRLDGLEALPGGRSIAVRLVTVSPPLGSDTECDASLTTWVTAISISREEMARAMQLDVFLDGEERAQLAITKER